jgi:hypothetical protein
MLCIILQAPRGLGRHRQIITPENFQTLRLLNWVYSLTCVILSFSILKISIALSLLRLSRARWYVYSLYALIGMFSGYLCCRIICCSISNTEINHSQIVFIVCYTIVALGSFLAYCTPIEASWNSSIKAKCYSREIFVAFSIFNNC